MTPTIANIVNLPEYPLSDPAFRARCKELLKNEGALVLPGFLASDAVREVQKEGRERQSEAWYTVEDHTIYLTPADRDYPPDHPRNRLVSSTKGCITDDQVSDRSALRILYGASEFRDFLCAVLGEDQLFEYADNLSSINLHYANKGQELGWHFDNSSFAITLMIQSPEAGGEFEYVKDVRDADAGTENYERLAHVLDGKAEVRSLAMEAGSLVLFRGRNSLHRVTPARGSVTRMLVVFAYNTEPGIALSESARMTFYGRLE